MSATATQYNIPAQKPQAKKISWKEFQKRYLSREDNFKYELVDGYVEKTPRTMEQKQQYIYDNLSDFLTQLRYEGKASGRLLSEVDSFFLDNIHRRPDIAYFTDEQRSLMAEGINQVPKFIVEVISSKDQINIVHEKMQNYRDAHVEIVWHIFPLLNEIHVYKGLTMTICKDVMLCSAEPVVPHFNISVNSIFKKP